MRILLSLALIGLGWICSSPLLANDANEMNGEMKDLFALFAEEQIVITPSKYPQPIRHSPLDDHGDFGR